MELYLCITSYTKINSAWIIKLNTKAEIIKHLKENVGKNNPEFGLGRFMV